MDITTGFLLLFIGFFSGAYGIIVGAGGGFIFVPALLILLNLPSPIAAGSGLAVVLLNALSGVFGYVRQKRIDYRIGLTLAVGAIPGTFIGVWLSHITSSRTFNWIFATVLIALGLFLMLKSVLSRAAINTGQLEAAVSSEQEKLSEKHGLLDTPVYTTGLLIIGLVLGIVSSFFGIGGGWLLVPVLIYVFRVAPHMATATSLFSLCLYSLAGVIVQFFHQHLDWNTVLWGGVGVLFGAQLGVFLSSKLSGNLIVQLLSVLLLGVGLKLLFT